MARGEEVQGKEGHLQQEGFYSVYSSFLPSLISSQEGLKVNSQYLSICVCASVG